MKLDLSCPIEVRGYSLSYAEGRAEASVRLYNLSAHRVASIEAVAKWRSSAADLSMATPFTAERLRAGGESGFQLSLTTDHLPDADRLELLFTRVRFEDGAPDWRSGDGPFAELTPLPAIDAESLSMLRAVAGPDAACHPEQRSRTWRCVCGRMNPNDADRCARCHRDHFTALSYTPDSVRLRHEQKRAAAPEADLSALHADYLRQRRRLLRRTMLAAVAVLALTVLLVLTVDPGNSSNNQARSASEAAALDS